MEVLKPRRPLRRWAWIAALAAWLLVSACLSLPTTRRSEPSFPHRVHTIDNQLACTFCHGAARTAERPGMPPPELCAPCHDRFDADKPAERRVGAFFDANSRYREVAASGLTGDVMFSHQRHVTTNGLACESCHGDVAHQDDVPLAPLASKPMCMDCHAQYGKANACAECHRTIDDRWRPPSHAQAWVRGHGDVVRIGSDRSVDRCELCHQDATGCAACHHQVQPQDHDNAFRERTHGLRAEIDRTRCAVCHTQDSCQQCHEITRPRSHRGGFGEPQDRHCVSCHLPAADNGCAVCHDGTPSHDLAAALPANHVPSMNCRLCHGNGVYLPHPDGGHVCTACHK